MILFNPSYSDGIQFGFAMFGMTHVRVHKSLKKCLKHTLLLPGLYFGNDLVEIH